MGKRNILVIAVSVIGLAVAWALFAVATGAVHPVHLRAERSQARCAGDDRRLGDSSCLLQPGVSCRQEGDKVGLVGL